MEWILFHSWNEVGVLIERLFEHGSVDTTGVQPEPMDQELEKDGELCPYTPLLSFALGPYTLNNAFNLPVAV